MSTQLGTTNKLVGGVDDFGNPFSSECFSAILAAVDTTLAVPLTSSSGSPMATQFNKFLAVFTYTPAAEVWVAKNAVASAAVGAAFAPTASTLNPPAKFCQAGDVLHFFAVGPPPEVSVQFFAIQT